MILNDTIVASLNIPDGKAEAFYWDWSLKHFGVRVQRRKRTFLIQWSANGKTRRHALGAWPELKYEQAREMAVAALEHIRAGRDPAALAEVEKAEIAAAGITVRELFDEFIASKGKVRDKSRASYEFYAYDLGEPLLDYPMAAVSKRVMSTFLNNLRQRKTKRDESKTISVNTLGPARTFFKGAFDYAVEVHDLPLNPVVGKSPKRIKRARRLDDHELRLIWEASKSSKVTPAYGRLVRAILLVPLRREEYGSLHSTELDERQMVLRLPQERVKSGDRTGEGRIVPVTPYLLDIIKQGGTTPFLFAQTCGTYPFSNWSCEKRKLDKVIAELNNGVPIPQWGLHDARRVMKIRMVSNLGLDHVVTERCLGHKLDNLTETYMPDALLPRQRDAFARYEQYILGIVGEEPPASSVTPLAAHGAGVA